MTMETAKSETTSDNGGTASPDSGSASPDGGSGSDSSRSSNSDGAPKNYSRGENQKPVTDTYRENWNHIFRRKTSGKR